jgi:vacuolar-type H+-ATPase subunit F/Vma7
MGLLGGLIVKLGADSKGYNKTLTKAGVMAKNVGKKIKSSLSGRMVGLFGVAALGKFAKDALEAANKVDHLSRRLNIGTEDFQKLDFAAKMSGTTTDSLAISLQRIDEAQGRLAIGNKETAAAFKMFGIEADEAIGIDKADLFKRVAAELKNIVPTGQQKRAIQQLFGAEAGLKNIRMFTEGLDDMMQKASDSGTIMADEQIRMAADVKDDLAAFKAEMLPIFLTIATSAMSAAVSVVDHVKVVIGAVAMVIVKTQEVLSKTWDRMRDDARGTIKEITGYIAKVGFNTSIPGMLFNKKTGGSAGSKNQSEFASDMAGIAAAFSDELTAGMVELAKKREAREAASLAARAKASQDVTGLGATGGGKATKIKADALARIGGFRGTISPEVGLLKRSLEHQRQIARHSRRTADNTASLT